MIEAQLLKVFTEFDSVDADIASAAWASTRSGSYKLSGKTQNDIEKLVTMLVHEEHDTPKEVVWLKFFISCPIFVERQIDKYRMTVQRQNISLEYDLGSMGRDFITQNEYSGRYRTMLNDFISMPEDVKRIWSDGHRVLDDMKEPYDIGLQWDDILKYQYDTYKSWLTEMWSAYQEGHITNEEYKRFREFTRGLLGTAYFTHMHWFMNINAFEHILSQRLKPEAQVETRILASLMLDEVLKLENPPKIIKEMLEKHNWK